ADDEEAVGGHFLEPDLGWILPPDRAACHALRLFGKRSLRELLQLTHGAADSRPQKPSPVVALTKRLAHRGAPARSLYLANVKLRASREDDAQPFGSCSKKGLTIYPRSRDVSARAPLVCRGVVMNTPGGHARSPDHPLSRCQGRPRRQGHQLPGAARRRRPG